MNAYQQKWIDVLQNAHVPNWEISDQDNDILIEVPDNHNIKELADNLETVLAEVSLDITVPKERLKFIVREVSLDITVPKERLKFIVRNSREMVDYVLNPEKGDLESGKE